MERDQLDGMQQAEQLSIEVSRRSALTMLGKLGLGAAALGALAKGASPLEAMAETRPEALAKHSYRFVLVNHVTTNPFFVPTKTGAQDACTLLGSSYNWTGSINSNVGEMVTAMQTAIAGSVDGIGVPMIDPSAFNAPTRNALRKGIPVISYNADVQASGRLGYIGQELFASGVSMGQRIAANVKPGSKIVLFIATPGQGNIQPRIDGAKSVLNAKYNVSTITTGADANGERSAVEAFYVGHKDVKGMFAVDGGSTEGVALTSKKYGLQKKGVYTGGFDLVPGTVKAIGTGDMGFTIDQQPYLQGFFPILQMFLYKASNTLISPSDTNTGLKFVTSANIKSYQSSSPFEGS